MDGGTRERCSGTNLDGTPCSGYRQPSSPFCVFHDPARRERIVAGRVKGGRGKSNQARAAKALSKTAMSVAELEGYLDTVFKAVITGKLAPGVAVAAATVARVKLAAAEAAAIETRLTALEAAAASDRWRTGT